MIFNTKKYCIDYSSDSNSNNTYIEFRIRTSYLFFFGRFWILLDTCMFDLIVFRLNLVYIVSKTVANQLLKRRSMQILQEYGADSYDDG